MNKTNLIQAATTFSLAFSLLSSSPAYAYLDPGTGSIILQGVIGAISAFIVVLRLYWYRLLQFFGLKKNAAETSTPLPERNSLEDNDTL
jgi:hypothetical protein